MTAGIRWTEEQFAAWARSNAGVLPSPGPGKVWIQSPSGHTWVLADITESPPAAPERPRTGATAKVPPTPRKRGMNKLESRYAQLLDIEKHAGNIRWWSFEAIRLKLADGAYYKPDFMVQTRDGRLEIHETKGHMREAAHVRIKVAARLFPVYDFYILRWERGEWTRTRVPG